MQSLEKQVRDAKASEPSTGISCWMDVRKCTPRLGNMNEDEHQLYVNSTAVKDLKGTDLENGRI